MAVGTRYGRAPDVFMYCVIEIHNKNTSRLDSQVKKKADGDLVLGIDKFRKPKKIKIYFTALSVVLVYKNITILIYEV